MAQHEVTLSSETRERKKRLREKERKKIARRTIILFMPLQLRDTAQAVPETERILDSHDLNGDFPTQKKDSTTSTLLLSAMWPCTKRSS